MVACIIPKYEDIYYGDNCSLVIHDVVGASFPKVPPDYNSFFLHDQCYEKFKEA